MSKQELSYSYNPESFLRVGQVGFGSQPALTEHRIFARHWWLRVFDSAPHPTPCPKKKRLQPEPSLCDPWIREDLEIYAYLSLPPSADLSRLIKVTQNICPVLKLLERLLSQDPRRKVFHGLWSLAASLRRRCLGMLCPTFLLILLSQELRDEETSF